MKVILSYYCYYFVCLKHAQSLGLLGLLQLILGEFIILLGKKLFPEIDNISSLDFLHAENLLVDFKGMILLIN